MTQAATQHYSPGHTHWSSVPEAVSARGSARLTPLWGGCAEQEEDHHDMVGCFNGVACVHTPGRLRSGA